LRSLDDLQFNYGWRILSALRKNKVNANVGIFHKQSGSEIYAKAGSEPGSEINAKAGSESGKSNFGSSILMEDKKIFSYLR
jgi:hypothetical protein